MAYICVGNNPQMAPSRCTRRRRPLRATTKPAAPDSPSPQPTTTTTNSDSPRPPLPGSSPSDHILFDHSFSAKTNAVGGGGDGCTTPKAKRFRIPEPETCPPAPKKQRPLPGTNSSCSLRRSPIPFLAASPDIELFFVALRTSDQRAS